MTHPNVTVVDHPLIRHKLTIMREATFAPSPALLKLAEITDFDLYVSTTFDSLLEDAINAARCGYFIPVISANTQRRVEGWFRREWNWAVDRTEGMLAGARLSCPCASTTRRKKARTCPSSF